MKRRNFGFLSASSVATLAAGTGWTRDARAASADKAAMLKTTLTPMGAERAGNTDGSIPAWAGGATTVPAGWTAGQAIIPDMFAGEKPLYSISSSNMAQYGGGLSEGVKFLMQKSGFSLNVYPTHRTASAPQAIYDNIYQNALSGQPNPRGARFGFQNAFGGVPFPIPDEGSNQGAEIMWNHLTRWNGYNYNRSLSAFSVIDGNVVLGATLLVHLHYDYYAPGGSAATYGNVLRRLRNNLTAPPVLYGQQLIEYDYTDPSEQPAEIWQLLQGQGRVRKAPELAFDTPAPGTAGIQFFDEINGFFGSPERYDWKCLGKQEMFIPYNNNAQYFAAPNDLMQPHFLNPDLVRWEKHRVWVVDATLAPGERNVVARRRFYFDEDTWIVALADEYDSRGSLWKLITAYNEVRPDVCGTLFGATCTQDLQAGKYLYGGAPFADSRYGGALDTSNLSPQLFNSEDMAAQAEF